MALRTNATVVRWRKGMSRRCKVFPPLSEDHFAFGSLCLLCAHRLGVNVGGDGVQIIALYPGTEQRKQFDEGWFVKCYGLIVHHWCAARRTDDELDVLAGVRVEVFDGEGEPHGVS